jgi:acyl dehydratase
MQGKITATNMRDMVKWGTAFDSGKAQAAVKAVLAELEGGPAEAADAEAAPAKKPEGLNWDLLHRRYAAAPFFVKENQTRLYAKATNDANPYYVDDAREGGVIAPVLFPVRILYDIQFAAMLDPELNVDVMMLLYGSQDMRFHAPIHPGDIIETKAEISKFEDKETGEIFDLKQWCVRDGEPVTEVTSRFFIRKPGAKRSKPKEKEEPALPELMFSEPMTVREDQTEDYALASKDTNPIHLDEAIAKSAGLKGRILHGLCSMAFASQAMVKHACDGVPTRLRRLKVRFGKPIFLGDTVTTQAWRVDESDDALLLGFQVVNQDGVVVLTQGEAEVAKA